MNNGNGNGGLKHAEVLLIVAAAALIGALATTLPVMAEAILAIAKRGC